MPLTRYQLTTRDLAILESLAAVRCLTVEHVQWLHWQPEWRSSAKAARAAGQRHYGPKNAYRRLRAMALNDLVRPIIRMAERGVSLYRRLPMAYALTAQGAALLATEHEQEYAASHDERQRPRAVLTLEHQLAIGACYASLHAEAAYRGRRLTDWAADHHLSADYDTVVVPSQPRPLPVLADATFVLDGQRCFVEIDRGTTSAERWRRKALAQRAYAGSAAMQARYGVSTSTVLVIAPSAPRIATIARTIAEVYGGAPPHYRFLEAARVHPTLIRRKWQQIEHVAFSSAGQAQLTWRETALWTPTGEEQ